MDRLGADHPLPNLHGAGQFDEEVKVGKGVKVGQVGGGENPQFTGPHHAGGVRAGIGDADDLEVEASATVIAQKGEQIATGISAADDSRPEPYLRLGAPSDEILVVSVHVVWPPLKSR